MKVSTTLSSSKPRPRPEFRPWHDKDSLASVNKLVLIGLEKSLGSLNRLGQHLLVLACHKSIDMTILKCQKSRSCLGLSWNSSVWLSIPRPELKQILTGNKIGPDKRVFYSFEQESTSINEFWLPSLGIG
jgi:hypothetical protein